MPTLLSRSVLLSSAIISMTSGLLCGQRFALVPAPRAELPGSADSNSPAHWFENALFVFTSNGMPVRSQGEDQFQLRQAKAVLFDHYLNVPKWIEATWLDEDGTLYAWYHNEPGGVCGEQPLSAPRIGALVSYNNGSSFFDLGFILESGDAPNCEARNGYFAGGHGDFSVILDRERRYFYFFFSNYGGPTESQGVAVARMAFADRKNPVGAVYKYFAGGWNEPGLFGRITPIFPARADWSDEATDSFWGPAIHWNTALQRYVMLLNRACCSPGWPPEGLYVSSSNNLEEPMSWAEPIKLMDRGGWYPQVIGLGPGETDKEAGAISRFYVGGYSEWLLKVEPDEE